MILRVHLQGTQDYDIGDEIWQQSLEEAITAEAETIAGYAGPALQGSPDQPRRDALRDRLIAEMSSALVVAGDEYQAQTGSGTRLLATRRVAPVRSDSWLPTQRNPWLRKCSDSKICLSGRQAADA